MPELRAQVQGLSYPERLAAAWVDAMAPRKADAPTVVSTFAGGGGSSLGYRMAGYRVLLAVEWEAYPASCYRLNFPGTPVHEGDIRDLSVEEVLRLTGLRPGELDVFDGSPPCQGFSTAGKREVDDPRNTLFKDYVRLLRGLRPRAFVMENVSGMIKGEMKRVFATCLRELRTSGYRVSCRLLDAKWLGVPQTRQRVIFVGARDDLGIEPSDGPLDEATGRVPFHPQPFGPPVTIAQALPHLKARERAGRFTAGWAGDEDREVLVEDPSPSITRTGIGPALRDRFVVKDDDRRFGRFTSGWKNKMDREVSLDEPSLAVTRGGISSAGRGPGWNPYNKEFDPHTEPVNTIPAIPWMRKGDAGLVASAPSDNDLARRIPAPPLRGKSLEVSEQLRPGRRGSDVTDGWYDQHRLDPDRPGSTVTRVGALYDEYPKTVHPTETRGLSIGEVMRLQSFPDEYAWPEEGTSWARAWAVLGNSVPPLMMRAVADHVRRAILEKGPRVRRRAR